MPFVSPLLAFLSLSLAGVQAPVAVTPAPASLHPITVQLMTVVDFPDVLGGQRVRVPTLAVKHVLGPRLLVVGRPHILGIDRSYQATFRYDELLVLLPAAANLAPEQAITVTGNVLTVAAARATGLRLDEEAKDKDAQKKMRWIGKRVVIVADSVETQDGVVLVGVNR